MGLGGQEPCTPPHPTSKVSPKGRFSALEEAQASCRPSGCFFPSHHRHQQCPWRTWVPQHGSISA